MQDIKKKENKDFALFQVIRQSFGNAIKKVFFTGTFWKTGYRNRKWISLNMVKFVSDKKKKWLADLERKFERLEH